MYRYSRRSQDIDVIIAIGGGSSTDTAKAVNMLKFGEKPLVEMVDRLKAYQIILIVPY